ncbi:MAG: UDP-N-acetylmuramoyl-L-alanine--D-glutamate ligase [Chloroflexota bacterium]|nr:UDP-N-acetylmuramoyl-L-alanine--D-glutamate ligase [Chloroflexota bacterium]MDE2839274.1 UDP-N-acetylmuramoyl-L-alanine--D-glutamate ligase [Chloroflexota bacterium]MDE2931126.1 UDP-N-acetylmuramoyl-L-alanine--D-glutamate ligase [Chloroflexota bacterium]
MDIYPDNDKVKWTAENLSGCRAVVMGLGLHGGGVGVAQYLAAQGATVTVTDLRDEETLRPSLAELEGLPLRYVLGRHEERDFQNADLVLRNPAVPLDSPYLALAQEAGTRIEMESSLFVNACPSAFIAGITGTKGKTTTTVLLSQMLDAAGYHVVTAGNLRVSMLSQLADITAKTRVVLELSSWQLEAFVPHGYSPPLAVVTNVLPDHLNRYAGMDDYAAAKEINVRNQRQTDVAVLNKDNAYTRAMGARAPGKVVWFSGQDAIPGEGEAQGSGAHQRENMAAASVAARQWGVDESAIATALRDFTGVPHRQELVREWRGIRFINDTTATMPTATVACIEAIPGPKVLLLGGADKKLDFTGLTAALQAHSDMIRGIVLLEGSATNRLAAALPLPVAGRHADIAQALEQAVALARNGDAIILSPGCASFGMFQHEFERGDAFRAWVAALPE